MVNAVYRNDKFNRKQVDEFTEEIQFYTAEHKTIYDRQKKWSKIKY